METQIKNKIEVSPYGKIKVEWTDQPHNYSKENKNKIKSYFSKKYNVNKNNIDVNYKPIKINSNGDIVEITGAGIDNIMDINYQRALMKELIARDNKNIDFNRILALDDKVNGELNIDLSVSQHKKWSIKWLMVDNFLSYGENTFISFDALKGLIIVNSEPKNQSGKTSLTIDAIKFLLHGITTKTDKNEQIFNIFTDKNELVVRGMIDIEGQEVVIERKMKRSLKKDGGWTVVNKVNYFKILPDGEEELLNDEDAKKTTNVIKETVGSEKDFELLVLATEKNLDDLISLTTTESGKILTRLIGLEVLEMKETIVRNMYNDFSKKKKSNEYDIITLTSDIEEHNDKIIKAKELEVLLNEKLKETKEKIAELREENDKLINSKEKIDVTISSLNPSNLEKEINELTIKGKSLKVDITNLEKKLKEFDGISFDEDLHYGATKKHLEQSNIKAVKESEIKKINKTIKELIDGGICQSCYRKLDNVDNTEHIESNIKEIEKITNELNEIDKTISNLSDVLNDLNQTKIKIDQKNKIELEKDRLEVEVGSLRNKFTEKNNDLKKYNLNIKSIEHNKNVDVLISKIKTDLSVQEYSKEDTIVKIERVINDIKTNEKDIVNKTNLIEIIKKEEEVDKIFKLYIELVGKKGISKLVLRSVLPIINSEVKRLLDDVCDFEVEVFVDDKNDVQFLLLKDDTTKLLKSGSGFEKTAASLALRSVLGKVSTLPMPNFITFDEVLGKVAADNLDNIRLLFDKIKDMYEIVFLITHNDVVKDWSNKILTIIKDDNISKIK
jgi:DNA repair exonuclease SbcCD ATPase subunit